MQINPYISFDGTCAEAFRFYETCLGGEVTMMLTWADSPMANEVPPEARGRIMHARLVKGGTALMGSDSPIGRHQPMQGTHILLTLTDVAEADRVFAALAEGGAVHMPIGETFWAKRFGMVADRFGTAWMINCEKAV